MKYVINVIFIITGLIGALSLWYAFTLFSAISAFQAATFATLCTVGSSIGGAIGSIGDSTLDGAQTGCRLSAEVGNAINSTLNAVGVPVYPESIFQIAAMGIVALGLSAAVLMHNYNRT